MPLGSKLTPPRGGHNFILIYIRKTSNNIFSWTAYGNLTKLHRNDPCVVPYQNCANRSSWLHKLVMGSINRFLKLNFKKSSCLKLQGPDLFYLVYSIIYRSFTTVVQIMPLGFSIFGSTVTFDLFLRWATQGPLGPLGPLVYLNIFSSETAHWILTKLHRNEPLVVPYQSCSNCFSWLLK